MKTIWLFLLLLVTAAAAQTRVDATTQIKNIIPGVPFVDGFNYTTIQAAINAAGTNGAVLIPPNYPGGDSYTNPNSIVVLDLRSRTLLLSGMNAVQSNFTISTTSPLGGGGDFTANRTFTCATCVTASSPSAGIPRFAGSTQTVTSAELSGDVTTSGSNATTVAKIQSTTVSGTTGTTNVVFSASPALTGSPTAPTQSQSDNSTKIASTAYVDRIAPGSTAAAVSWFSPGFTSGSVSVIATNVVRVAHFSLLTTVSFNTIGITNTAADAGSLFSFGVYSLDGTVLYAHTTAQGMTGSNTFRALSTVEGTVTIPQGDYLFAWTGNSLTGTFQTMNTFPSRLAPASSSTTTASGVMPAAPINVPALSPTQAAASIISFILYK